MMVLLVMFAAPMARAQYQPIPDYSGIDAGRQFRGDINNHLSGVSPISPRIVGLPLAQLPPEVDGQLYWCSDCSQTSPCTNGGEGALAIGRAGAWTCGGASGLPAGASSGNLLLDNGASAKWSNLTGDVSNSATTPGQLTVGSVLNGLTPLTTRNNASATAGTSAGRVLVYGQSQTQLTATTGGIALAGQSTTDANSVTACTVNAPASVASGHVEIAFIGDSNASGLPGGLAVTPPSGWTLVRSDESSDNQAAQWVYYHVAGASEPTSYTWAYNSSSNCYAGIADFTGVNTTTPVDQNSGGGVAAGSSLTVSALGANYHNETVAAGYVYANINVSPAIGWAHTSAWAVDTGNDETGAYYFQTVAGALPAYSINTYSSFAANINSGVASQVGLIPAATMTGMLALAGNGASFVRDVAASTPSYSTSINPLTGYSVNGRFNVVAYGADPTGQADAAPAINAAV
ncbi:MAG: hypothetical protein ACREQ4_13540, partial [Candidatus Binataceae bacterium]